MKALVLGLCVLMAEWSFASEGQATAPKQVTPPAASSTAEQEVLSLSKDKWRWMSERNIDALAALFPDNSVFVHMGGTMSKSQELDGTRGLACLSFTRVLTP